MNLLLLHGAWVGPWAVERYAEAARRRGWGVRTVDLGAARTVGAMVDAARAALDELGEAVVLGHSFGGLVALHLASDPRVRATALVAAVSPRGARDVPLGFQLAMLRYLPRIWAGSSFALRREDARRLFFDTVPQADAEAALDRYAEASGRAIRAAMLGAVRPAPAVSPLLVVGAERDRYAPPRIQRALAQRLGAEYEEVPGAGHMVALSPGWEQHVESVLDWLSANARSASR